MQRQSDRVLVMAKPQLYSSGPWNCPSPETVTTEPVQSGLILFLTRILEWVVTPFSRGSFQPRDQTRVSYVQPALAAGFFTTGAL